MKNVRLKVCAMATAIALLVTAIVTLGICQWQQNKSFGHETSRIQQLRHDINNVYNGTLQMTSLGESASSWDSLTKAQYHEVMLKADSALERISACYQRGDTIREIRMMLRRKENLVMKLADLHQEREADNDNIAIDTTITVTDYHTEIETIRGNLLHKRQSRVSSKAHKRDVPVKGINDYILGLQKERSDQISDFNKELAALNRMLDKAIGQVVLKAEKVSVEEMKRQEDLKNVSSWRTVNIVLFILLIIMALLYRSLTWVRKYHRQNKATTQALMQSNEEKQELLDTRRTIVYSIIHELRSPLSALTTFPQMIKEENDRQKIDEHADNISGTVSTMNDMVDNLLNYFKAESGKLELCPAPFKISTLGEYVRSAYSMIAERKGLSLDVSIDDDEVLVGDANVLRIVLGNLVSNAIKFTDEGHVSVDMRYDNGQLNLIVADEGTGHCCLLKSPEMPMYKGQGVSGF